jgi:hypothetical protein
MLRSITRALALLAVASIVAPAQANGLATVQQEERRQDERRTPPPPPPGQDQPPVRQDDRRQPPVRQDDRNPPPAQDDQQRAAPQAYRVKNVLGAKVSIQGDIAIGTVDDIVFNDEGYIEYLIVNNDNQLRTVPWAAAKFNFERKTATVNVTQSQIQSIPTYTPDRLPTFFSPSYRTEVYRFYGLTPREVRRMDRLDRR